MTQTNQTVHKKTFNAAWGDMDALGHVNNARYFDYFQQARIEWLASIGFGLRDKKGPVVIHVACTFLKPVVYPAALTVHSRISEPGRSSFWMHYDLKQNNILMAEGSCKIVWVDYHSNQSIPIPDTIRTLFSDTRTQK